MTSGIGDVEQGAGNIGQGVGRTGWMREWEKQEGAEQRKEVVPFHDQNQQVNII